MRNLTVAGKFLISMVLLGSLTACGAHSPLQSNSVQNSVVGPWGHSNSAVYYGYKLWQEKEYRLNDLQKTKQTASVYSALEGDYGVAYKWYEKDAWGAAKAVHGYPQGSGFCKVVYTMLVVRDKQKTFEETACKEEGHKGWRFIVK